MMKSFKRNFPCPICGGFDEQERGKGKRCYGFISSCSRYAHCTREEFSGGLPLVSGSNTFAHLLDGSCNCGLNHGLSADTTSASGNGSVIVTWYDYFDEHGELLFQVGRKSPKGFTQRQPDGKDGWINNVQGVRRVLYRLPELIAADKGRTVFVCEGEKDCEALKRLNLIATTNSGGAEKWLDEYSETLRGRNVVILPDNDDAGRRHAQKVSASLNGIASSIKIVELPELSKHG